MTAILMIGRPKMTSSTTFAAVTFDCANALALAEFWSAVLDRPIDARDPGADQEFARLKPTMTGEPWMVFVQVRNAKVAKNRVHLDLTTNDRVADVERFLKLGATRIHDKAERGEEWTTMADPEGNEFCIVEH